MSPPTSPLFGFSSDADRCIEVGRCRVNRICVCRSSAIPLVAASPRRFGRADAFMNVDHVWPARRSIRAVRWRRYACRSFRTDGPLKSTSMYPRASPRFVDARASTNNRDKPAVIP
jgi:hypothetical protein